MNRERYAYSIINLKRKVFKKAKEVFGKREGAKWWHDKIMEYSKRMSILENDYQTCMSYHILNGSNDKGEEILPVVDFYQISSVRNFCLMTLSELNRKERKE